MNKIVLKTRLGEGIWEYVVSAPRVASAAEPGQFVILRLHERGERIPLTIADFDGEQGTITFVAQSAGKTTTELNRDFEQGDTILDVAGPLGNPSEIENYGKVVVIGGGVGIALIYPIAKALKKAGNHVISIIGAQTEKKLFYREKIDVVSDEMFVTTDDGTAGRKGFTSDAFREVLEERTIDKSWAIGPVIMMKVLADVAEEFDTELIVSLNSTMVDGTGMCGGCRVEVGGEAKFACVDGPEFEADLVDFDLLMQRLNTYQEEEQCALDQYLEEGGSQ